MEAGLPSSSRQGASKGQKQPEGLACKPAAPQGSTFSGQSRLGSRDPGSSWGQGGRPPPPAQGSRREQRAARARKEQRAKECAVTSGPEKRGGTMAAGDPATAPEPGGWPPALPHSGLGSTLMPVCAGSTAGRLPVPPELGTCPHGAQCCLTNRRPGHLGPLSQLTPQGFRCGSGLPALASFSHPQRERNSRLPRGRTGPPLVWGEPCPPRAAPSPQEPIPQTHWWWVPPPTSQAED